LEFITIYIGIVIDNSSFKKALGSVETIQTLGSTGTLIVAAFPAFIAFFTLHK
jgi:hypothetical protein